LSQGLFTFFAPESVGVLSADWEFSDSGGGEGGSGGGGGSSGGGGGDDNNPPEPAVEKTPKPTLEPSPKATHSYSDKISSSSSSALPHHKATSTSTSTSSSLDLNKGPASGLAVPTGTISPDGPQGINVMNQAIIGMGGMVSAGANLN
jgi:hypothetical protein